MNRNTNCSINNIYRLEGRVPIAKAIPFGLQDRKSTRLNSSH